jgi:arabinogalactan endo-1,4-beta-galactosidase
MKKEYMTQETAAQNIKNQLKSSTENEKIEDFERKPEHGQFYWELEWAPVDKEKSLACLCSSGVKGETWSLITAAPR